MKELGKIHQLIVPFFGHDMVFNLEVILMTWIVIALLTVFGILAVRKMGIIPHYIQMVGEMFVSQMYGMTEDSLGKELARKYAPMICALFMFLLLSNWLGIIPHLHEPTKDLNTPLGMGIMGFFVAHYVGIKEKGFKGYLGNYFEPFFFMLPLNIIDALSKVISISFRLFGNIMGGSIIILVVSYLTYSLVLPPILNVFFGLFVGTIQAFVFTMLTVTYISLQVN
ncbi:MAG: F0F1 ATP synthase subunit A [Desulfobacterales bacterium]